MIFTHETYKEVYVEAEIDHYPAQKAARNYPGAPEENYVTELKIEGYPADELYWIPPDVLKTLKSQNKALGAFIANLYTLREILKDTVKDDDLIEEWRESHG